MSKTNRYISYFASVITVGLVGEAESTEEAREKAQKALEGSEKLAYYCSDQTEFEVVGTEVWDPEFEVKDNQENESIEFNFKPSEKTKNVIGLMMKKKPSELTREDYEHFVKQSIQFALDGKGKGKGVSKK